MTNILIFKTRNGTYKGFSCIGHAGYGDSGEDIVCAAISVLVINTINSMEVLAGEVFSLLTDGDKGLIDCRFEGSINDKSKLLIDAMVLGLESIEKQYGNNYLKLTIEEV